ncbi:MAG: hypothetical protein JNK15_12050 [Planctomycetes bacterium]|nr:hypothetical protein [Planctomycetota bacterium]
MRMFVIAASLAAVLPAQDPSDTLDVASRKAAYTAFQAKDAELGAKWIAQWSAATATPTSIYGTGLKLDDWRENTLEEARRHALLQLQQHKVMLGLGTSDFREIIGARMGRTWSFVFDQYYADLPVVGGRADVRINMKGVVAMLGSLAVQIPQGFSTVPTIGEELALATAWAKLGADPTGVPQPGAARPTKLVIWADLAKTDDIAEPHLAWEVPISNVDKNGFGPIGRYYVDATTGAVLSYTNDKHECGLASCNKPGHVAPMARPEVAPTRTEAAAPVLTTVTVMGWTRTGLDATAALVNVPMARLTLTVPGVGTVTTDANGEFTIDIAAAVNITIGALDGTHHGAMIDTTASGPSGTFTVNPGVNTTIQLLTSAATTNQAAHTSCSYWLDQSNEWARSILGNSAELNTADAISPQVNQTGTCNAYYTGNSVHFYPTGGGCNNTAFSTVVTHEWGHGLDERYGGISNVTGDGLSEGWGDILGCYLMDSPNLGQGFQTPGVALRSGNNTKMYGTQSEVHAAGEIWMGFAWKYRENLRANYGTPTAIAVSNDTVVGSIVADATNQATAVQEVFIADDNDGNLLNGVPHYAELSAAAIAKGIPYPQIQLASVTHTTLGNTAQRLTPRQVLATVAPISGSINQVRLHYNAGAGNQQRNMHPTGAVNGYEALLPGVIVGAVSYHFEVVHSTSTVVRYPASGELTYTVTGGTFGGFYSENFDSGAAGWTTGLLSGLTNDWQLGDPAGKTSTTSGITWIDPQNAVSGLNVYSTDLGIGTSNGRYPNSVNEWLRSPIVDCSGKAGVKLRFQRWLSVEEGLYDQATVWCNGVQVWANPTSGHTLDTAWQSMEISLPMADNNPSVQLEWRLTTDVSLNLGGWQIDNVELGETIAPTVDCDYTLLPEQAAQGTAMTATISTPGGSRPFLLGLGDTVGPTLVPGFPAVYIGGNLVVLGGSTDAAGLATFPATAPTIASAIGVKLYSQVLTVDAGFTTFVVSNPFFNLFTQTP